MDTKIILVALYKEYEKYLSNTRDFDEKDEYIDYDEKYLTLPYFMEWLEDGEINFED